MQLEEETAGIAQHGAGFVSSPQRRCRGPTVLADGLKTNGVSCVCNVKLLSIAVSIDKALDDLRSFMSEAVTLTGPFCCPPAVAAGAYCAWFMLFGVVDLELRRQCVSKFF
jgi:hypothetical protein